MAMRTWLSRPPSCHVRSRLACLASFASSRLPFSFPPPPPAAAASSSPLWTCTASPSSSFFTSLWSSAPSPKTRTRCSKNATLLKDVDLHVPVLLEESLDSNAQLETLLKQLEHDGPLALRLALDGMDDLPSAESVELSVVICNDDYICKLNKEWRGEDTPTDVLSFPQNQPPGLSSTLLLGDVIISVDTAIRQAEERGHSVLDEFRVLLVHGLLHVLGYDHEEGPIAASKMENEESRILKCLGWKSKGLINASSDKISGETEAASVEKERK